MPEMVHYGCACAQFDGTTPSLRETGREATVSFNAS
jgi:hypothetical protein